MIKNKSHIFIITALLISFNAWAGHPKYGEVIIPERARIAFLPLQEAILQISIQPHSDPCSSDPDLKTKEAYQDGKLIVDIKLGNYTPYILAPSDVTCTRVIPEINTVIKIDMDWLKGSDKEIIFRLQNKENKYKISYINDRIILSPVEAVNVISQKTSLNSIDTPKILEKIITRD